MEYIKKYLRPTAFWIGIPFFKIALRKIIRQQRVFILMYHRVDHRTRPLFGDVVKPDVFEKQIHFLKRNFTIVDLCDLKKLDFKKNFKRDIVVLTFDDGYRDNYSYAFPILKKNDVPATVFLTTGYINTDQLLWYDRLAWILYKAKSIPNVSSLVKQNVPREIAEATMHFFSADPLSHTNILHVLFLKLKRLSAETRYDTLNRLAKVCDSQSQPGMDQRAMLSWDEVREMAEHSISFGAHTVNHPVLAEIPIQDARKEIVESKKTIENEIQKAVNAFAYPFGISKDYSKNITEILKEKGFEYACSAIRGYEQFPFKNYFNLKRRGATRSPYLFL